MTLYPSLCTRTTFSKPHIRRRRRGCRDVVYVYPRALSLQLTLRMLLLSPDLSPPQSSEPELSVLPPNGEKECEFSSPAIPKSRYPVTGTEQVQRNEKSLAKPIGLQVMVPGTGAFRNLAVGAERELMGFCRRQINGKEVGTETAVRKSRRLFPDVVEGRPNGWGFEVEGECVECVDVGKGMLCGRCKVAVERLERKRWEESGESTLRICGI